MSKLLSAKIKTDRGSVKCGSGLGLRRHDKEELMFPSAEAIFFQQSRILLKKLGFYIEKAKHAHMV